MGCPLILTALFRDIGWEVDWEGSWLLLLTHTHPGSTSLVPLELSKGVPAWQVLLAKSSPLLVGTALQTGLCSL